MTEELQASIDRNSEIIETLNAQLETVSSDLSRVADAMQTLADSGRTFDPDIGFAEDSISPILDAIGRLENAILARG